MQMTLSRERSLLMTTVPQLAEAVQTWLTTQPTRRHERRASCNGAPSSVGRLLKGAASEKGKAAAVTRGLVEQALALGAGCMRLLLADALYADGPLLAWLKYVYTIDALAALPEDRLL